MASRHLMKTLNIFFVSDHTGLTAEAVGVSLLSQFSGLDWKTRTVPFIDTADKAAALADQINQSQPAMIISTLADARLRETLKASGLMVLDVFEHMLPSLAAQLDSEPTAVHGLTHSMNAQYDARIDAVNYALAADDGQKPERMDEADLILVGVSRAGKTPVSLYLAMQYGIRAANYPLTPEDFARGNLPDEVMRNLPRVRGLTLSAERLAAIRQARYPGSRYAGLDECRKELTAADALFLHHGIPVMDSTRMSVEEIAARLRNL